MLNWKIILLKGNTTLSYSTSNHKGDDPAHKAYINLTFL